MPSELLSDSAAAGAVGMINAIASMGGLIGPYAFGYLNSRMGSMSYGFAMMMIGAIAGGLMVLQTPRSRRVQPR